jgi:uncharacterized protein
LGNGFEKPEPFVSGESLVITYELPDIYHAFREGHRVMVQVQSSWFPLVDRNPQVFMEIQCQADGFQTRRRSAFTAPAKWPRPLRC